MLTLLHIENIAVVERTDIEPGPGLNILTGETGAGKSIIIDAIGVIAGGRASKDLIRTGEKNATVSALFNDLSPSALNWIKENGYTPDEDGNILIFRQISSEGRSLCKINGMPVTVTQLKELGGILLNIHGQHDNQSLLFENTHLAYLDSFAGHDDVVDSYQTLYNELMEIEENIRNMAVDEKEKVRLVEQLRYRIEEIGSADLQIGEEEELEARREILRNSERMTDGLEDCFRALYGDEDTEGACGLLNTAEFSFSDISAVDRRLEPLHDRLKDIRFVAEDLATEIRDLRDLYIYSPEEMEQVESRLDLIFRMKRKYGDSIEEILKTLSRDKDELEKIEFADDELKKLTAKRDTIYKKTMEAGEKLRHSREMKAIELSDMIMESLTKLDMPKVQFEVDIIAKDEPGPDGLDEVCFLLSANPGEELRSISRIASGGELSRIMLAMKNVLVKNDEIQTLIFDEIDSGVSGRAAQRVAEMLAEVSEEKQVLCVTHLSQIAAMADNHFSVEKSERGGRVYTTVNQLDEKSATEEIARIISATAITESTLKSAGEMIADAKAYKKRG